MTIRRYRPIDPYGAEMSVELTRSYGATFSVRHWCRCNAFKAVMHGAQEMADHSYRATRDAGTCNCGSDRRPIDGVPDEDQLAVL